MSAARTLNAVERRVIGVLIEKALALPQYYPMTVSAVVAGCNQKSNRDPAMDLDEEAVWDALERLRAAELVSRVMPGGGSRVERFRHETPTQLGWEKPQRALLAELLLRGPQTVGELRGRCQRMHPFENAEAVQAVLDNLAAADPPWVALLPRAAGQSAQRYAHTLYEPDEWARLSSGATDGAHAVPSRAPAGTTNDAHELQEQLEALRATVDDLAARVAALENRQA